MPRCIRRQLRSFHLMLRNQWLVVMILCMVVERDLILLAVAAAASPVISDHTSLKIDQYSPNHYPKSPNRLRLWIRNSLRIHASVPCLHASLNIRGGESDPDDLDSSDLDDDVKAEDLLDAIFDNQDDSKEPSKKRPRKKSQKQVDKPIKDEKLQSSVKQKASSIVLESTSSVKSTPASQFKGRTSSQQPRSSRISRRSIPNLELAAKNGAGGTVFSNNRRFHYTLNKQIGRSGITVAQGNSNQRDHDTTNNAPHNNKRYSLGEGLLPDSYVSRNKRNESTDVQSSTSRRRLASPEVLRTQQIRAAPTVATSRTTSKILSPAFLRRGSPTTTTDSSRASKNHAIWGPHVQHRKTKSGPPPTKATEDERRAHESQSRISEERKSLLSSLAIRMNDSHTAAVRALIRGSAAHIPPELFGQSIMQEKSACNEKFYGSVTEVQSSFERTAKVGSRSDGTLLGEEFDSTSPSFRHIEDPTLLSYWGLTPHAKLYGGAQYHRVLRYYHHLFLTVPLPPITDDEVALLTNGITEVHDASDLMRAVALLVRQKMEIVMEDVLADMTRRLLYVLDRQWEMVEYSMALHRPMGGANGLGKSGDKVLSEAELLNRHGIEYNAAETSLKKILSTAFHNFAREKAELAHRQSLEDIRSLLRYVTWDMGRARKRAPNQNNKSLGFVSQIEIVGGDREAASFDSSKDATIGDKQPQEKRPNKSKQNTNSSQQVKISGSSERIMARGGGAVGSGRKRSRRRNDGEKGDQGLRKDGKATSFGGNEYGVDDMGDLIGGVMNRGKPDESDEESSASINHSVVISSQSSPLFSGDDEVLSVLLATVSSTLALKSDIQAGHTQAAIENLVHYVTDRMRMDMSRMIRSKFNSFFLLAFYEDLGTYLRKELHAYLSSIE